MRKYFLLFVSLIFAAIFFFQSPLIFDQTIQAQATTTIQCTCDHPNHTGNNTNLNGYHCPDKNYPYNSFCGNQEQMCVPQSGYRIHQTVIPGGRFGQTKFINYVGVYCKTQITCQCANSYKDLNCHNPVTNQNYTHSCFAQQKICQYGSNLQYNVWSQFVPGIDCQQACHCNHPGQPGFNRNGWTCSDTSHNGACGNIEDYCQNTPGKPGAVQCVNSTTCKCNGNHLDCVAKNVFPTHTNPNETYSVDCAAEGKVCKTGPGLQHIVFNQAIKGIDCMPLVTATLGPPPPPPSPPCAAWNNGQCSMFATAFGDFSTDPTGFIKKIFDVLLSVSGGIALLLIIKSGYQLMTSQGKPEQMQQGRDQLIAAIVGLIFLIFSFVALQVIGFDILQIPGFGP